MSFYQVKEKQGGGRCKIYLLPSENFDPGVVNLSKESSQLNRKHEEERGALVVVVEGLGCLGWWGGVVVGGGGGTHTHELNHFKRGTFQSCGVEGGLEEGCPCHVYNPETDPSQPAYLPPALPQPPLRRPSAPPNKKKE